MQKKQTPNVGVSSLAAQPAPEKVMDIAAWEKAREAAGLPRRSQLRREAKEVRRG